MAIAMVISIHSPAQVAILVAQNATAGRRGMPWSSTCPGDISKKMGRINDTSGCPAGNVS